MICNYTEYSKIKIRKGDWYTSPRTRDYFRDNDTVWIKKTSNGLWWEYGRMYIPVKYVVEVIEGNDLIEYLI